MAQTGTVKWFDAAKGFGFIIPDDGGKDVFVHISTLTGCFPAIDALKENDRISFDVQKSPKGLSAVNLSRIPVKRAA